jgi:chromosome segregation ATPase
MTPELIAAIVGLLLALTGLVKVWTEVAKVKASRASTAVQRDRTEQELRDLIQKTSWECQRNKEDILFMKTHLDDQQVQVSTLNTEIAKLGTKMDSVLEAVKELKQ